MVALCAVVVVAIGAGSGVALLAPDERHHGPVDRPQDGAGVGEDRAQVALVARPPHTRELDAGAANAGLLERLVEPGRVGALGKPEAPRPLAEAAAVRGDPGLDL